MEINWVKPSGKLPDYEVLAVGYQDEMLVGILFRGASGVECESESTILYDVRYYIPLKDLRRTLPKENK